MRRQEQDTQTDESKADETEQQIQRRAFELYSARGQEPGHELDDGLALQRHLAEMHHSLPIVFIAAVVDENEQARAMQAGAVHFLRKPASEQTLIRAVQTALAPKVCLCRELSVTVNRSVTHVH